MATLVLTTVGAIVGGPIGAAVGAAIGSQVDQRLFAPKRRQGPRLDDLSVQTSTYGAPVPRIFGTIRATGNIIWSSGLKETAHRTGGGKQSGGRTTTFSYSASFAVALSARPIVGIGRIWADGKLLRGASGELTAEAQLRIHLGGEEQQADPLIVAAEGAGNAPAYRGLAYAVFEDLQLADFANRIPNLAFEVIADAAPPTVGEIAGDLAGAVGETVVIDGLAEAAGGFLAARDAPLATWVDALSALGPVRVGGDARTLRFLDRATETAMAVSPRTLVAAREPHSFAARAADAAVATVMTVGFLDPARDYQSGLQRAFRPAPTRREEHVDLPLAVPADTAKRLAQDLLQRRWQQRTSARRRLGYRALALAPGDRISAEDGTRWEVRRTTLEGMAVEIEIEPAPADPGGDVAADGGRANGQPDQPQGETVFHAVEAPPIAGELPTKPRLWIAAGGTGAGWRRAEVWTSPDAGATWASVGIAGSAGAIGTLLTPLALPLNGDWDGRPVEVELISDAMWLEGRGDLSVLAGANMAIIGNEIIQFARAEAIAPRRFRLSRLLRGRRASAAVQHSPGERFALLDPATLFAIDLSTEVIGAEMLVRLVAPNTPFADAPTVAHRITGAALRPLSPVHLTARALANGDIEIGWVRRSRAGFGWIDGADAPLGAAHEAYRVCVSQGAVSAVYETNESRLLLTVAAQVAAFGGLAGDIAVEVVQLSDIAGEGVAANATATFTR